MKPTMRVISQALQRHSASARFRKTGRSSLSVHFTRNDLLSLLPWIVVLLIAMAMGTWLGLIFPGDIISD